MAQITAAMVKQLREMTDSPMMECKKALVEADGDVRIRLGVAQLDVETRPEVLDEALFGDQRLGLGLGDQELDALDQAGHLGVAAGEMRGDALSDRDRLADIYDFVVLVPEQVDTRRVGQCPALGNQPGLSCLVHRHLSKGRLPAVPSIRQGAS